MEEIREVPRGIKKKQKEVKLLKEHNTLEQHWGDVRTSNLNQPLSDFHYKHHVTRLMRTYTRPAGNVDHIMKPINRVVKAGTQLYGVNGLRTSYSEEELKRMEDGWEGRVDIHEKLDSVSRKKFGLGESSFERDPFTNDTNFGKFNNHRTGSRSPERHHSSDTHGFPVTNGKSRKKVKKLSRRANFDGISEHDLIANGLYAFTPQQLTIYNKFTAMIAEFDNTDMIHILEDALETARSHTGLEDYDGFAGSDK